ncbi:MAG: hypothetical protein IPK73_29905 [Candidatus Obscuribacter sp.]|nr:hypothetical protein [Candidatus Obscuribacter sp.]
MTKYNIQDYLKEKKTQEQLEQKQNLLDRRAAGSAKERFLAVCSFLKSYGQNSEFGLEVNQQGSNFCKIRSSINQKKKIELIIEDRNLTVCYEGNRGTRHESYLATELPMSGAADTTYFAWIPKAEGNEEFTDSELAEHIIVSLAKTI